MSETSILRDITNKIAETSEGQKVATAWSGNHLRFDEEGNREVVIKDIIEKEEEKAIDVEENTTEEVVNDDEEQAEEYHEEEFEGEEETEDPSLWEYREPKKVEWCGTHIKFKDDDDEEEIEPEEVKETPADVMALEDSLSQLSTKSE